MTYREEVDYLIESEKSEELNQLFIEHLERSMSLEDLCTTEEVDYYMANLNEIFSIGDSKKRKSVLRAKKYKELVSKLSKTIKGIYEV